MNESKIDTSQIDIVMVGTTHPGNIGAAARAMNNMRFRNLVLVDPQCPVGEIAYARSSGAHAILDNRKTFDNLLGAIAERHMVIGMTARQRSLSWPEMKPEELANKILAGRAGMRIALVFGREHSGLTNDELALCQFMVSIPANPDFSSLNVASAIQIICYEIYKTLKGSQIEMRVPITEEQATSHDLEGYYSHLEQVLLQTGFLDAEYPGLLMQRLRRLYQRVDLSRTEVNILRGILSSVEKYKK